MDTHVYIGSLVCGCHVAVVVDEIAAPQRTAKTVQEFIKNGYTISRHTLDEYRAGTISLARCVHNPNRKIVD